jgi:hypothetical protein
MRDMLAFFKGSYILPDYSDREITEPERSYMKLEQV